MGIRVFISENAIVVGFLLLLSAEISLPIKGFESESVSYFRGIGIALTQLATELKAFRHSGVHWIALCIR